MNAKDNVKNLLESEIIKQSLRYQDACDAWEMAQDLADKLRSKKRMIEDLLRDLRARIKEIEE